MNVASDSSTESLDAIILAAGRGKRLGGGDRAKVAHEVAGRPMIHWVVDACHGAGVTRCIVVVGHGGDEVRSILEDYDGVEFVEQTELLGTGHATMMAEPLFASQPNRDVFVLAGDGPLLRSQTLETLLKVHRDTGAAATLATALLDDPTGYGRIARDGAGQFDYIVEQKDASDEELAIREINPSYYCFQSDALFTSLKQVSSDNAQGEYYLTDVPGILKQQGRTVSIVDAVPPEDVMGINTPQQLAEVDAVLRRRHGLTTEPGEVA